MIRQIDIDIFSKEDLVEKYNEDVVSKDLINYILEKSMFLRKEEKIRVVFHKSRQISINCKNVLLAGFKEEYNKSSKIKKFVNIKEIFLFIIGFILIYISTKINSSALGSEIFLIIGWVPIWEVVELELIEESSERRKRRALRRLLKSEIVEEVIKE